MQDYRTNHIQATIVSVKNLTWPYSFSYNLLPIKTKVSEKMFSEFFKSPGSRYVAGGDWNQSTHTGGPELRRPEEHN